MIRLLVIDDDYFDIMAFKRFFKNVDTDKQIALNSSLLNTSQYLDNIPAFNNYQKDKQKQKELMSKLIENEVKT